MLIFIAVVLLVAAAVVWSLRIHSSLVRCRSRISDAWCETKVNLQRRSDLVPLLAEIVEKHSEHERELMPEIARRCAQAMSATTPAEQARAENSLSNGLRAVFALAEACPEIEAEESYAELRRRFEQVEDRLQMAHREYNDAVESYNTLVESFPSLLPARLWGFRPIEPFQMDYAIERPPLEPGLPGAADEGQ